MSTQYVLLEKSGVIAGTTSPNYLIHKVAEDMLLQTYALHLARVMSKVNPAAEYLIVNVSHLAGSIDELVNISPKALNDALVKATADNFVRRYNAEDDGFKYEVATAIA